ncbi:paraquat-inducible protein A [Endozoicomonas sp. ALD040]|uniref:paraquat-inducible protein A n=1 Tax=unclassified Endozoicomonas TaxID=2644528 RepID=UPI003BB06366
MTEPRNFSIAAPLIVLIISLGLLIPGITQPMITLQADMNRQALVKEGQKIMEQQSIHPALLTMANQFLSNLKVEGQSRVYDKTRSILGTASDLWNFGYKFVAILILTFSVLIPAIKSLLLLASCHSPSRRVALKVNAALGKWSMADVFAMGIIIAMLAANATASESALLNFQAELHCGFYLFVAYCLVSGLTGQLLLKEQP